MEKNPMKIIGLHVILLLSSNLITNLALALTPMQCVQSCDWFNSTFPLCANTTTGWGFEDGQSCISRQACEAPWNTGGVVEECDGRDDAALCASMVDREYYSDRLFSLGLHDLSYYNHLQVAFYEDTLAATYSDVIFDGGYRCENGEVLVDIFGSPEYAIDLSDDLTQLHFSPQPQGELIDYTLKTKDGTGCGLLANQRYEVDPSELAAVTLPAGTNYSVEFSTQSYGHMQVPEGNFDNMLYDCAMGELHLHRSTSDGTPITGSIEDEGASLLLKLDENTTWRFLREEEPVICPNLYEPVCSVEPQDIVCVTAPCPIGVYKTYPNRCVSDNAPATFIQEGECGDLEGEPYYDQEVCTTEYDPVCTAWINPEACLIAPCPVRQYRTFSNSCVARAAGGAELRDGECGEVEGDRIVDLSGDVGCPGVWQPVCAKDVSGIVCVTEPCPTHEYVTFGNSCEATVAVADIAWPHQACGDLEGITSNTAPPVEMVEIAISSGVEVRDAAIRDDTLYVTLRHGGCEPQYFDFQVERDIAENGETHWAFRPVLLQAQTCLAYQDSELRFDLTPLKALYEERYGDGPATIVLPDLVDYTINESSETEPELDVQHPETVLQRESVTVQVRGVWFGEEPIGYPVLSVANPSGQTVVTRDESALIGGPGSWEYNLIANYTAVENGYYSIRVIWEEAELEYSARIGAIEYPPSDCEEKGIDVSNVNQYPNFPNLDWKGDPYNANYGDYMSYYGEVYRARWWTTSVPGSDASWEFACKL